MLVKLKAKLPEGKYSSLHVIFRVIIFWVFFLLLLFIVGTFVVKLFPVSLERFVYGISGTLVVATVSWGMLKIDKKHFKDIGLVWNSKTILNFIKGIAIGSFLFSLILSALLLFTELNIQKNTSGLSLMNAAAYLAILPLAFMEELAFRAYPFFKLNKVFGLRVSQLIVAIAFALYHIISGWGILAAFLGPAIWAFIFGLSAKWSGGIAMPTGIHVALNVWQPLTGMSTGTYASVWILKYKDGVSDMQISKTDFVGIILQLLIFLSAIFLTEYYIRKIAKPD